MSDTVKLIVTISKDEYEIRKRVLKDPRSRFITECEFAIANGTPLDDVKAEIEDLDRFYDNDYFSGNRDSMFKCNEVMQILDNIGKAESESE